MSLITKTQHNFDSLLVMNDQTRIKINAIDTCQHPSSFVQHSNHCLLIRFLFIIFYVELFLKGWKSNNVNNIQRHKEGCCLICIKLKDSSANPFNLQRWYWFYQTIKVCCIKPMITYTVHSALYLLQIEISRLLIAGLNG